MTKGVKLMDKYDWIYAIVASGCGYLFGVYDIFFQVLITFIVFDIITGLMKAAKGRGNVGKEAACNSAGFIKSSVLLNGLGKKFLMILTVAFSVQLDKILGDSGAIRLLVVNLLLFNEAVSIIENLSAYGIEFPKKVMDMLEVLKSENKGEN